MDRDETQTDQEAGPDKSSAEHAVGSPGRDDGLGGSPGRDDVLERLDEAEEAGDEARLAVLEEINDELEAELEMNRPRAGGAAEGVSEGGEARPPGR